ncbi:MAG TPA: FAD binding domain-containing protein [Candidatus Angelobacter sp.]|nr:FAD binding domain-containing protein [Candidatus Angelobacter sp.]
MRAPANICEVRSPKNLGEALGLIASSPNAWKPLAGGTDVMVALAAGKLKDRCFLDLWCLNELRGVREEGGHFTIGALTTHSEILQHTALCSALPLLAAAAAEIGGVANQNRGTIGGNIMNASPAADIPPVLLVYEAEVEFASIRGARWVPYSGMHIGYRQTLCAPDELLTRIRLPRLYAHMRSCYRKVGARRAQAISKVCMAAVVDDAGQDVRIAFGSVAPFPVRCYRTEEAVQRGEDPARSLATELTPINDMRSTAAYRMRVAQNLLTGFLKHES